MERTEISEYFIRKLLQQLTIAQLLLIAQSNLASVIHLSADRGLLIQIVLGGDAKFRSLGARCPRQLDASFQAIVDTLINAATEFAAIVAAKKKDFVYRHVTLRSTFVPTSPIKITSETFSRECKFRKITNGLKGSARFLFLSEENGTIYQFKTLTRSCAEQNRQWCSREQSCCRSTCSFVSQMPTDSQQAILHSRRQLMR